MAWTEERIAQLKLYWGEGRSASQIAELLGDGLSRNAVIGKAHRLGLASRPSPLKTGDGKPKAKTTKPKAAKADEAKTDAPVAEAAAEPVAKPAVAAQPAPKPVEPPVAPAPKPVAPKPVVAAPIFNPEVRQPPRAKGAKVTLLDLNDRICKWPIGHPDEADFHFCGKPVNPTFPYCSEHCLVAYQAQMPRKDRPAQPARPFTPNLPRPR